MAKIIAGIPAFDEEKTIGSMVLAARRYVDEVVVVDDGSNDRTAWIAEQAGAYVVRHDVNRGYGAAVRSCFRHARNNGTELLVILDGDGQHHPDAIPQVIEPILQGRADVSIGSRFLRPTSLAKVPRYRRFGIKVLTKLTNLGSRNNRHVVDGQSGFRAYSRRAVDTIDPLEENMGASAEILWEADKWGLKVVEVPIEVDYDIGGSTQGPIRHALGVIGSMVRYVETEHPLLTMGLPGALFIIFGMALGLDVVERYYASPTHSLAVGLAMLTILFTIVGSMLGLGGIILHAVMNANKRKR